MKDKVEKIKSLMHEVLFILENDFSFEQNLNEEEEFQTLSSLLNSEEWPEAVWQIQIADENSEEDKLERAEGIVDTILPSLENKKFLDFGCGEGHVAKYVSKTSNVSVGYDIQNNNSKLNWENKDSNLLLTTSFEKVKAEGPYDIILIYDVLDHAKNQTMSEILSQANSVLAPEGRIYLRCHPWCGRHGGHLYRKINKAFVHLVFSEKELKNLGFELEFNSKTYFPLITYQKAIEEAGLTKEAEPDIDFEDVEDFFIQNEIIKKRILKSFGLYEWIPEKPSFQMSCCFIDYILKDSNL